MAHYNLRFKSTVTKDMRGIPQADVVRILARIENLRENPRPLDCEKLSAQERYRVRQGSYRILYTIEDSALIVEIVKVGHRREVYREI
jgi:mRNA interferase RelE/StbE